MTELERNIIIRALQNEKDSLIKRRNVIEIGTIQRETLENEITTIVKLINSL